jgi:hypothetical protein
MAPDSVPPIMPNPYSSPQPSGWSSGEVAGGPVSARTISELRQTRPWVLFLSILGFILAGLMTLGAIAITIMVFFAPARVAGLAAGQSAMMWIGAFLYFVFPYYLFRYSSRIGLLLYSPEVRYLEQALEAQKSFWRLAGIVTIVMMALYAVIVVGVLIFAPRGL